MDPLTAVTWLRNRPPHMFENTWYAHPEEEKVHDRFAVVCRAAELCVQPVAVV
jgi:hypothetical protein